jgi:hypothetical protein
MRAASGSIRPIFAQQSIREMMRTNRTPQQVFDDAQAGALAAGWTGPAGADADHLKTIDDVERTVEAGFVFFTIDPSDDVDPCADDYSEAGIDQRYFDEVEVAPWEERYAGGSIGLSTGTRFELTPAVCRRAAVKYGRALRRTVALARHINAVMQLRGVDYELELSVDETPQPTTLAEHYLIASECLRHGISLISLAPRYVGEFEKGVDYKGDLGEFEASLRDHAAIAKKLGPYKLSLHSGSDKLSLYPILARVTQGWFHVKTAGTSYLEALRVAAHVQPGLFRQIVDFARTRYQTDRATYHVSATLEGVPAPQSVGSDRELERLYLELWEEVPPGRGFTQPGRQILHTTFGSVLNHPELGPALRSVLVSHPEEYAAILEEHFRRHLEALNEGL